MAPSSSAESESEEERAAEQQAGAQGAHACAEEAGASRQRASSSGECHSHLSRPVGATGVVLCACSLAAIKRPLHVVCASHTHLPAAAHHPTTHAHIAGVSSPRSSPPASPAAPRKPAPLLLPAGAEETAQCMSASGE
jgi:hypothetical protein